MNTSRIRPRILFLVDALDHDYQSNITRGVVRAAQHAEADLMVLVGGRMVHVNKHLEQRQFIYESANPKDFDGVILLGTSLSSQAGHAAIAPLIIRFANLPMVSIGLNIGKGCTVLVDNTDGMNKLAEHLLDVHQFKKFAYISGPENNGEARLRLKAFESALASKHLHLPSQNLVIGAFNETSGEAAVCQLIDERHVNIAELDAIVAANDSMAVGAMDELNRRGIHVPSDVAIVGFDDIEAARYADTPLTTIQQPLIMQGERAVERVLSSLPMAINETIEVGPKLVVRRSCGCGTEIKAPVLSTSPPTAAETLDRIVAQKRSKIESDLAMVAARGGISRGWESAFVDLLIDACAGKGYREITQFVGREVNKSIETGEGVHAWATTLAALDKHLSMFVTTGSDESARVEAILHRSRLAMSEAVEHFHATKVRELKNRTSAFNEAAISMLTSLDAESLLNVAASHIPKLGIDTCSIALFEGDYPNSQSMRRFLVLKNGKRLSNQDNFSSRTIAAPEIVESIPHALIVEPLCFYEKIYGVAAFGYGPREGLVYEQLGAFCSAAVNALITSGKRAQSTSDADSLTHVDPLTGAYTPIHMTRRFTAEIARAQESDQPLTLILMDMDNFQQLNDALGEAMGDEALKGIVETIERNTKPTAVIGRVAADKFAILSPNTNVEQGKALASLISRRLKLALSFKYHGHISASFGIATTIGPHDIDEVRLMESAEHALSASKQNGKDRFTHIDELS